MRKSTVLVAALFASLAGTLSAQTTSDRSGFSMLLTTGVGLQKDEFYGEAKTGLAGINLGIGGFVNDGLAVMLRVSGTSAKYFDAWQTSGTGGVSIQFFPTEKVHVEVGAGVGFWDTGGVRESSIGTILGVGYSVWSNAGHNVYLGAEYAPAFTSPEMVHNLGFVLGWQLL